MAAATTSVHDPRITTVGLLFEACSGVGAFTARDLARHGLASPEFEVLIRLARSPGRHLRMSDLAEQVAMSPSGLTRLADRLERRGLIARLPCPTDRRGYLAQLTAEGERVVDAALGPHLRTIEECLTGVLTDRELAGLVAALRKVRAVVRPGATVGADTDPAAP